MKDNDAENTSPKGWDPTLKSQISICELYIHFCKPPSSPDKEQYYPLEDVSWWSDNVLILARCSGSVTVSSVRTLRNLLGKSCEWFEPSPRVTAAHDGGFLSLEVRGRDGSVCARVCVVALADGQRERREFVSSGTWDSCPMSASFSAGSAL